MSLGTNLKPYRFDIFQIAGWGSTDVHPVLVFGGLVAATTMPKNLDDKIPERISTSAAVEVRDGVEKVCKCLWAIELEGMSSEKSPVDLCAEPLRGESEGHRHPVAIPTYQGV